MRILFIHKNYPAQFGAIGAWLAKKGWDVIFATEREGVENQPVRVVRFGSNREVTNGIHQYLAGVEQGLITGQGFARTAIAMRNQGYEPDVVVAHSGWGVGTFVKDIWPNTKFIPYYEWFYSFPAIDRTPHDAPPRDDVDQSAKTRVRNTPFWLDMSGASAALCPTQFQADQFPDILKDRLTVMHDGVDTKLHSPGPRNEALMNEFGIPMDAEVMSWVTRGMEPARGFPEMMRAVEVIQKKRPNFHAIIVGEDRVAYGAKNVDSWKVKLLKELDLDESRLHFTGLVPRTKMIEIIRSANFHLYLTAPFVLSWSLLDSMACGTSILASDVEPVREFILEGVTGRLVDTYDPEAMVRRIEETLDGESFGEAARKLIVDQYDADTVIYPAKMKFFESVRDGA